MKVTSKSLQKKFADGKISMEELTSQANSFLHENKLLEAYPYIRTIALTSDSAVSDKMIAGILAVTLQKEDEAVELFTEVIKQEPKHYDANYNLALIDIYSKKYDAAVKRIESLLENNPESSELLNDLAVIATHQQNSEEAFSLWEKAIKINPNDSTVRNNALAHSLEKNFFKEADQLLAINEKSKQTSAKTKAEIDRWYTVLTEKKNELELQSENHQTDMELAKVE